MKFAAAGCGSSMDNMIKKEIRSFKLSCGQIACEITNYGGVVLALSAPDRSGRCEDVVLGYDSVDEYLNDTYYFGALIGRYANRIANGRFQLDGTVCELALNDGPNHLHGGRRGFDKIVWTPAAYSENQLKLEYISADMEENYPGRLYVQATYTLTENNELRIDYWAVGDRNTIVNLTNHAYFNLKGHGEGDILDHQLKLYADFYTPIDRQTIPTGEIAPVAGTPMDFRELRPIKANLDYEHPQIINGSGFDHNWVLNKSVGYDSEPGADLHLAAELFEPQSGRLMEVYTTKPGIQFYSGNFLAGPITGKKGAKYGKHSGLCLETQYFPNSPNYSHFPSPVLRAGTVYRHTTIYRFKVK